MIILVFNNAKQMLLYHGIQIYFSYLVFVEPKYGAQFFILHQGLKNIGTALGPSLLSSFADSGSNEQG